MTDHWVPGYFVYFVVLSTVLLIRKPVAEWAYRSSVRAGWWARQRATGRGPLALPTDDDPTIQTPAPPTTDPNNSRDLEGGAQVQIFSRPQFILLVPIILGTAGVVLSWYSLDAILVHDGRRDDEPCCSNDRPLGLHWFPTELVMAVSHVYIVLYSLVLLRLPKVVHSMFLPFATVTQTIGMQQIMLPIATFLVSVCVKLFKLVPWHPFTHETRNILITVVGQSLIGVGTFGWASVLRHQLDSKGDEVVGDLSHADNIQ